MTDRRIALPTLLCVLVLLPGAVSASASASTRAADGAKADGTAASAEARAPERSPFLGGFLASTRIAYPTRLGPWYAAGEKRYDEQELGVSVRFQHDDGGEHGWVDVFFFPAGVMEAERFVTIAKGERDTIIGQSGAFRDVEAGELTALADTASVAFAGAPAVQVFDMVGTARDDRRMVSAMVLALDRLYFVKIRHTRDARHADRAAVRDTVERFHRDLQPRLRIASTGECWDEPEVVFRAGPLDPSPSGALAVARADGRVTGIAFPDRIEVLESARDVALLLRATVMTQAGRRTAGCVAPDPQESAVEEGMREIRIDYRLPDGNGRKRPVSPRVTRSGIG